ncbi:MAG TPA: UbiA family prenyltransferase [Chitinophagaceae bacterium]|nr:UbiA family prenyltransferase [Chitinophagaceae bacterium]
MEVITKQYPVYSPLFWKEYGVQMRPYLLFLSGIAGASGIAMSHTGTGTWNLVLAFLAFFMGYGFGQALTDCFQTDTDKLSSPYRPLSKGTVSIRAVLGISLLGLLFCALVFYYLHWLSFLLSSLAVFGLYTYSYIKKNITIAGPFYNAWIVTLLPVMGYYSLSPATTVTFPAAYIPFLFVSFFSYGSFVLMGYLKDINADKATGYKTFPVVWGWKKTVIVGDVFALVTLCFFWLNGNHNFYETLAGIAASLVIIYGQYKAHIAKEATERAALHPILATVRSFIFFHIAIVIHFQINWWTYAIIYYILFEAFLYSRPSKYQV